MQLFGKAAAKSVILGRNYHKKGDKCTHTHINTERLTQTHTHYHREINAHTHTHTTTERLMHKTHTHTQFRNLCIIKYQLHTYGPPSDSHHSLSVIMCVCINLSVIMC